MSVAIAASTREALDSATQALAAVGVETPRLDAEVMLAEATGRGRADLVADSAAGVPPPAARRFGEMVRRRLRREPVAYVVGHRGFRAIELAVDGRVLVPRPETELLVELAVELAPRRVLDVGTGSGAIALAVADELPDCAVVATDASAAALEVARFNAERLGLAGRVEFLEGTLPPSDWSGPGHSAPDDGGGIRVDAAFDLVLANLPYVAEPDWPSLPPEVREWEPREALLAGADGLDAIRSLLSELERTCPRIPGTSALALPAALGLEIGAGQAAAVADLLREAGFVEVESRPDLAGIERVVVGRVPTEDER